jgi:hypothetical protein
MRKSTTILEPTRNLWLKRKRAKLLNLPENHKEEKFPRSSGEYLQATKLIARESFIPQRQLSNILSSSITNQKTIKELWNHHKQTFGR